jgi:acetate CoA/acetoacetate CoA-transferase beta subunit
MGIEMKNKMAKRAAKEIKNNMVVNLGIGIPSLVPNHLDSDKNVLFHAENGIVGMGRAPTHGEEDENLCNAGGFPVSLVEGGSYCDSCIAFAIIRRGIIDFTILGALQVSEQGDLANWIIPGKKVPGMGGATELANKSKKVIVLMTHCDKKGRSKLVKECDLPITAKKCVDLIITDQAVFSFRKQKLWLTEIFSPFTIEEVRKNTEASFYIDENVIHNKE